MDLYIEDLNRVCRVPPIKAEHSVKEMLEMLTNTDSSLEQEAIIQQNVDRSPALNSLVKVVLKIGELQMTGFPEQELEFNLDTDVLVSLVSWRLSVVADLIEKQTLDEVLDLLLLAEGLLGAVHGSVKRVPVASNETLKEQYVKLEEVFIRILEVEGSIFGCGYRIGHPVLQRAWTLVGLSRVHSSLIPRAWFSKILLALLQHEIGDDAFMRDEVMWKGCCKAFLSKIGDETDDELSVSELSLFCDFKLAKHHLEWHSLWRMLLETEFLWDYSDKIGTVTWRGDSNPDDLLNVKKLKLPVSVQESSTVWEFSIPQVGGLLGVDACVEVTVKMEGSVEGFATMQYQVGEREAQFACFISFKDSTGGFTIGCNAVSPGDDIKIWVTWPKVKRLNSIRFVLTVSAFHVVHDKAQDISCKMLL